MDLSKKFSLDRSIFLKTNLIQIALIFGIILVNFSCKSVVAPASYNYNISGNYASSDKYRLIWNDDPATTMTIGWDQKAGAGKPVVLYDTKDYGRRYRLYKYRQKPSVINLKYGMNTRFAKLTGLVPDTKYYFVLKDKKGVSKRYWFITAPDKPKAFTFIAGGDTKSKGASLEAGRASNRLASKLFPLFVLFAGDFTSGNGTDPDNWKLWLRDWFTLTTTKDGRMIPVIPVHGNHESGDKSNLFHIFNVPYQGNDSKNIFYSLSIGGNLLHIIVLNSEIERGGLQRYWLENNLKEHKDFTFKIAAYHKPFWPHTTRKRENPDIFYNWAYLFSKYRLSLSIDADSHISKITFPLSPNVTDKSFMGFVRDDVKGTMYIGEGSWGAHPRTNDDDKPWTYSSGSFNQFKWVHVLPGENGNKSKLKIFVAVSGTCGSGKDHEHFYHDADVEVLNEKNRFKIPANLKLQIFPDGKNYVVYPFEIKKEYLKK